MKQDPRKDSAGVPWQGRQFQENPWAGDDGQTPEEIALALSANPFDKIQFLNSLRNQRLLIPLLAELGEGEIGPHGQLVDKSADLAIVAVATPDGKTAIPAFTSVEAMSKWNSESRPVPVSVEKLCLAAASEGHERVVINPVTDSKVIRRTQIAALAQGLDLIDVAFDVKIAEIVSAAASTSEQILEVRLQDGDPEATLRGQELLIELKIKTGLSQEQLAEVLEVFVQALTNAKFDQLVDSFGIKVLAS